VALDNKGGFWPDVYYLWDARPIKYTVLLQHWYLRDVRRSNKEKHWLSFWTVQWLDPIALCDVSIIDWIMLLCIICRIGVWSVYCAVTIFDWLRQNNKYVNIYENRREEKSFGNCIYRNKEPPHHFILWYLRIKTGILLYWCWLCG